MTLQKLFLSCTQKHASQEAIVHGARRLTYQELHRLVNQIQGWLHQIGVRPGKTVGLFLPNSIEFVVTYFAVAAMGATVIPINPTLTSEELSYICRDGEVETLVCHVSHEPVIERLLKKIPIPNIITVPAPSVAGRHSFTQWIKEAPKIPFRPNPLSPDDVAAILYTSGTTGKPKGAMLTHKNLYSNAINGYETLLCTPHDAFLVALPLFHAFQATVGMLVPTVGGCKMVIAEEFKPSSIFELIEKERLTVFLGVPSMYLLFTRALNGEKPPSKFFRLCVSGGAALPVAVAKEFEEKFAVPVHEGYGLTEASPVCSVNPIDKPPKIGSIGLPLKGVTLRVVDEEGREIPRGQVGELVVQGENVMKGYHQLPEESQKTIRNGWLFTGDMARQDNEGYFYIVDRKKEMIIVAGENVYPREVEEVLYQHPAVAEAAVVGVPDELRGEVPWAYIRLKENAAADRKEILAFCRERLANFKIPRAVRFLEKFPKNATGKILKKELSKLS